MSSSFPVAPAASADKLRGGYYTPEPLGRFLAEWVSSSGPRVLEPSCGDGAILQFLPQKGGLTGIEVEHAEGTKARAAAPGAEVVDADFFQWLSNDEYGMWDGVAGNPPFIRFQNWTEPTRSMAFDVMRRVGMRPTKLTNAWVPFVVGSTKAVRPGGRLGLVIPAELLQVTYAAELRAFLVDEFAEITVVTFKRLLFKGLLQEVVLLLGVRGAGPAKIRVAEVEDASCLPAPKTLTALAHAPALRHDTEKWTKYFLPPDEIEALRDAREHPGLQRLGRLADVDVGVVTGRNQFFVLRPSGTETRGLTGYVMPLVSKSAHVRGVRFDESDLATLESADALCHLLAVDHALELTDHDTLSEYVGAGEDEEVHLGYKCSIRKQWWVVPSIWTPDAFLLRQIHDHPRVIANLTGATSTDTVHRVRMLNGTAPTALAAASVNSATFAFAEVMGRSYGGGVLELEPREAEGLPFPDPHDLPVGFEARVDLLVREGQLVAALDYVDEELLIGRLGMDPALVARLRGVWERLRDRRLARGRKSRC
ncbi:MAG: Eco57I restriction-modification methylase domain-containing protein [Solirubrobacteraceae bacterium]